MGYKALITIDLPGATGEERDAFYESLKKDNWKKLNNLTTAWTASFKDDVERQPAVEILENEIKKAKKESSISKVNFAIQLGKGVIVNN